jgi:hypothetical protein
VVSTPGKPVQRTVDTELADVMVGGQEVGVTNKGLVLAGTDVPLPPDSTVNAILSAAGVTVHYLAASQTPASIVAPGLSVAAVQDVPGVGETTVSYVFGQAAVSAQAKGAVPIAEPVLPMGPTGGAAPGSSAAGGAGATAAAPPPAAASGPIPPAPSPVTAGAPTPPATSFGLVAATGPSSQALYLVIAAGAIVMVAAALLFRVLAVKLAWT